MRFQERILALLTAVLAILSAGNPTQAAEPKARMLCTLVADAETGETLTKEGEACGTAVTPASTFKAAIALMGYDSGILKDAHTPALPFKEGYADWLPGWRQTTDPTLWMKESVVWYSQQMTQKLGEERFRAYVEAFDYGNQDVTGDPVKRDGLTTAWLSSSLKISPEDQVRFFRDLLAGTLPVSAQAREKTATLMRQEATPGGWTVYGKTGMGAPEGAGGEVDWNQPYGWFVGWAEKDGREVVFARLIQDRAKEETPTSFRARDSLLADLPALAERP